MLIKITDFTLLFSSVTIGLFLVYWLIFKFLINYKNPIRIAAFCISWCVIFLWLSLNLSQERTYNELSKENYIVSKGGFPLTCFYYPVCCLGGDKPPKEQLPKFFINYGFWFALVGATAIYFKEKIERKLASRKVFYGALALAVLINEVGLIFVILGFD